MDAEMIALAKAFSTGSGQGATVDDTLTQAGQAADAAAVGARLSSLSEEIANLPSGGSGSGVPVPAEGDVGKVPVVTDDLTYELKEMNGGGIYLTGAVVGQIAKIAAVDENGVPTEWEPVDLPSGGGGSAYQVLIDEDAIGNGANYVKCFDIPENANVLFLHWSNVAGDVYLTSNNTDTINWSNRVTMGNLSGNKASALLFRVGNYWCIMVIYGVGGTISGLKLTAGYKNLALYFNTALTSDVYVRGGVLA